jgi:hypothetical protein
MLPLKEEARRRPMVETGAGQAVAGEFWSRFLTALRQALAVGAA